MSQDVIAVKFKDRWTTLSLKSSQSRYVKPTLKKVSKYENKFAKLQKKVKFELGIRLKPSLNLHLILNTGFMKELIQAAEFNFRNQLKTVCYICL